MKNYMEDYIEEYRWLIDWIIKTKFNKYLNYGLYEDLVQSGILGLIEAHNRYDSSKGTKFSTYAYYWVYECVRRETIKSKKDLEIPVEDLELSSSFEYSNSSSNYSSNMIKILVDNILENDKISNCSKRDKEIVCRMFGINYDKESSQALGERFNISRIRIYQIIKKVLNNIKNNYKNSEEEKNV